MTEFIAVHSPELFATFLVVFVALLAFPLLSRIFGWGRK